MPRKKSSKGWSILNGVWIVLFLGLAVFDDELSVRKSVDRVRTTIQVVDLGTVKQPSDETSYQSTQHVWRAKGLAPYRVTFAHGHEAMSALYAEHAYLGQSSLPSECKYRPWGCVYTEVSRLSANDLSALLDRMELVIDRSNWNARDAARWLLTFVQDIPYRIPEELAFNVLPPPLVVSEDWGDCDSKSLLLLHLLKRAGIEARIFISRAHSHAMVGILLPTTGKTIRHEGREYAWAETTGRAPLGWIHPNMLKPNDWTGVDVRVTGR
ncbi:MAG: hypothetical protein O6944_06785 [Gammaproteobacteria bacterium]|nr:hypothetical protein [Gammaproteobacteria bacterium]